MLSPSRMYRRLRHLMTGSQRDAELDEELRSHIEMETEKHVRAGMSHRDAHARATHDFGGVARFRDETRDAHGVSVVEDFGKDVRIGVRALMKQRTFAIVSILTIALGIGGTTAVFGAVYGVLFAPLPFRDQDRVVNLQQTDSKTGKRSDDVASGNFVDWRERARSFSHLALAEPFSFDYIAPDGPEVFSIALVTGGFFEALGVRAVAGRTFVAEEYTPGHTQVVMLSERLWRTRFGGDTSLIGRTITLDGAPMVLVGIVPAAVDIPWNVQGYSPKVFRPDELQARRGAFYAAFGRLRDGVTIESAQQELDGISRAIAQENPSTNANVGVAVVPVVDALVGSARKGLLIIFGAIGFVLLIACVNVASLQLAQAVRRRRELATRAALGAGSFRLARQLMAESVVLGTLGGGLGVAVSYWGLALIRTIAPAGLPRVDEIHLQPAVLVFAALATIATSFLFGLAPIMEARRMNLSEVIGSAGRSVTGARARRRALSALVIGEVTLAVVLLVGAALLARSFRSLITVDRGYDTSNVLVSTVQAWSHYQTPEARTEYVRRSLERLAAIPGVDAVAMSSAMPLSDPIGAERAGLSVQDHPVPQGGENPAERVTAISPGYFNLLRTPVRAGRDFSLDDRENTTPVVIVNEAFVKKYWPGANPIGKKIGFAFMRVNAIREVVGVVADVRHEGLDRDATPTVFAPHAQAPTGAIHFGVRSTRDVAALEKPVRALITEMTPTLAVSEMTTLESLLGASLRERRFQLSLIGSFSIVALLLTAIGIFGVLSHVTGERTQEIGLRVAIGASGGQVLGMIVRQGLVLASTGAVLGIAVAFALTRVLRGMLFHVSPLDPVAFGSAVGLLAVVALLACWVPARRAAAVDPLTALRD